jgi:hypothetical protein
MHCQVISISELANWIERTEPMQTDIDGISLYTTRVNGRRVHVTQGSGDAILFCDLRDVSEVTGTFSKPLRHLHLV